MFEKINDSTDTEEEKGSVLEYKKTRPTNENRVNQRISRRWIVMNAEHQTGHSNTSVPLVEKCAKYGKKGHFTKCCRSNRKVNHVKEGETSCVLEVDWSPDRTHSLKQKKFSARSTNNNGPEFFTITALVNNRPNRFIIDSGSSVTLMPNSQFNYKTP